MEAKSQSMLELAKSLERLRDDLMRLSFVLQDLRFELPSNVNEEAAQTAQELLNRVAGLQDKH
jgi:uncharacterized sporulation protein YeaH/YhbH (DUF444 family)